MSSEVIPVRSARLARQVGKELERVHAAAAVEIARVRAVETVECCKIEALGATTDVGMRELARLGLSEVAWGSVSPSAQLGMRLLSVGAAADMRARLGQTNRRLG
jgi:hypothetical protein